MSKSLLVVLLCLWTTTRECLAVETQTDQTVREHQFQIHGVDIVDRETVTNERVKRQAYFTQPQERQPQRQIFLQKYHLQPPPRPQSQSFPSRPTAFVVPTVPVVDPNGSAQYDYPPRARLPLPKCFHNPTGYVCCNVQLNDLIVETYTELEARPKFHTCNVQALATHVQRMAEKSFNTTFETIAGYEDFAQKIHFKGDLVCKVELGGKYMLAYGTVKNVVEGRLPAIDGYDQHGPVERPQESHRFRI